MSRSLTQTLEPLPVPAFLFDMAQERFVGSNQAMRDLLGYSDQELRELDWRQMMAPEQIKVAERAIERGIDLLTKPIRWKWRSRDGRTIPVVLVSRSMDFVDDDLAIHTVIITLVLSTGEEPTPAETAFPK